MGTYGFDRVVWCARMSSQYRPEWRATGVIRTLMKHWMDRGGNDGNQQDVARELVAMQ